MHCLAKSVNEHELKDDQLSQYIRRTKECLNGKMNEEDADQIMSEIWDYSKDKWPEYIRNEEVSNQEDVAEYLHRMLNESTNIRNLFTTEAATTQTCHNPDCDMMSLKTRETRSINVAKVDEELSSITIQEIVNEKILEKEERSCPSCHHTATVEFRIIKAPELLCVHYSRNLEDGEKIETKITNPDKIINVKEKEKLVKYKIKSVIIHRGTETGSGHHICNVYDESRNEWTQIDDHRIKTNNRVREENTEGVVYVFKKVKDEPAKPNEKEYSRRTRGLMEPNRRRVKETNEIPCMYYRKNECEKDRECPYLHYTCPHHLRGICKYKEQCRYRHVDTDQRTSIDEESRTMRSDSYQNQTHYYTTHYYNPSQQA